MISKSKILVPVFVLLAVTGGAALFGLAIRGGAQQLEYVTVWPAPMALPEFQLTTQTGAPFEKSDLADRWSLVFFGFTQCPDICPTTLLTLSKAQAQLMESGHTVPDVILVSVDPERDSPEVLGAYVSHFGDRVSGLTGDLEQVRVLTSAIGIFFEKAASTGGQYTVDHSAVVLLVNPDAEIHGSFGAPHAVANFVHDLPLITD